MNEEVARAIGARLRAARLAARLTQAEVATDFLRSRQTISAWERGQVLPGLREFRELASLYGASSDWLLYGLRTAPVGSPMLAAILSARPPMEMRA